MAQEGIRRGIFLVVALFAGGLLASGEEARVFGVLIALLLANSLLPAR